MARSNPPRTTVDSELVSRTRMAVLRLARRLRQQSHAGITPSQQSALAAIEHSGPLTLGALATIENVQPPSITRIVTALEDQGYVERRSGPEDRRVSTVAISAAGTRELRIIRDERNAWLRTQLATLSPGELRRLENALPVIERLFGGDA